MRNRILDYPEATEITSNDYILLDNEGTGAKCIKASALNINMDNYTIKEARGAIASFDDGEDLPLAFMGAYITAIQEGSGDPSPSNVRPIIGWDEVNVTVADATTSPTVSNVYTLTFTDGSNPLTVYGGTVDLVNGVLTVTHGKLDLGSINYNYTGGRFVSGGIAEIKAPATNYEKANVLCEIYKTVPSADTESASNDSVIGISRYNNICIRDSRYSDATQFKTAMNGVQLVYELATPLTYSLTKQQIRSLVRENVIFADTGDSVVDYRKLWVMPEM